MRNKSDPSDTPVDPASIIAALVRSHSDVLRLRDNLMEQIQRSECHPWDRRAWTALFNSIETWGSQLIDFDVLEAPSEEMFGIADAISAGEREACPCFIEAFMFFRALRYVAELRSQAQLAQMQ